MMAPYLIKQIVDADNQTMRKTKLTDAGRPISADSLEAHQHDAGRRLPAVRPGTPMAIPNVSVAAKTGNCRPARATATRAVFLLPQTTP